jgi:putative sterol carrier protein
MSSKLESFFADLPEKAKEKDLTGVRATYAFVVDGGKTWTVHVDGADVTVTAGAEASADCTISASEETFDRLLERTLGTMSAYLSGKLRISGGLDAAMQLQKLLSS